MRILCCGGAGYLGSAICSYLQDKAYERDSVDLEWFGSPHKGGWVSDTAGLIRDDLMPTISAWGDYRDLTKEQLQTYDVVILAAAHSSVHMCEKDPIGAFKNNVDNFVGLLDKLTTQKFIYMSSSCVYTGIMDATEEHPLSTPVDNLTMTKSIIDWYAQRSNVEYYGLRLGSVAGYSPNFRTDLMVNAMTLAAMNRKPVKVTNPGKYRPILAMSDLCRAVDTIVKCREDNRGIYNLASFNKKIEDVGVTVAQNFGVSLEVDKSIDNGYDFTMNCDKFRDTFGFGFKEKLEKLVEKMPMDILGPINGLMMGNRNKDIRYRPND